MSWLVLSGFRFEGNRGRGGGPVPDKTATISVASQRESIVASINNILSLFRAKTYLEE